MKLLLTLLLCATIPAMAAQPITFNSKVGFSIRNILKTNQSKTDAIVILKEKADLTAAPKINDRSERLQFVYDSLKTAAEKSQPAVVEFLKSKNISHQRFLIMNMIAVEGVTAEDIQALSQRADVERVVANPAIKTEELPAVSSPIELRRKFDGVIPTIEGGVLSTGAPNIWNITQGQGIIVAGQDTGVQWDHPALKTSYVGNAAGAIDHSYAWHDSIKKDISGSDNPCGRNITAPCDDNAHGTHTVGSIVGDDGATNKIGMAPKAQWMACRNMDNGVGRPTTYIECFEFFLAPYKQGETIFTDGNPTKAPHIINNSWGCPESENCEGSEFIPVLEALYQAGIMVVVSAGNEGSGCSTIQDPPAHHTDLTLSVGAHDHRNGTIASFSSRGPSAFDGGIGPDVTAPGVSIRSAVPGNAYQGVMWSGTSMAGPHAVGLVALMWSANKSLIGNIDQTIELVRKTATPKTTTENCGDVAGTQVPNNTFGYGQINAEKAVKSAVALKEVKNKQSK